MPDSLLILLIENQDSAGPRLSRQLSDGEQLKAHIVSCRSLLEAEAELARALVDLVLVDAAALDMTLVAAVKQLKARVPHTPLVALSSNADDAVAAVEAGAEDWLPNADLSAVVLQRRLRLALARHDSERHLRGQEQELRLLFDYNPSPVLVYRLDTLEFLAVNDAAARFYGYSRDALLGMTLEDIRHPEDTAKLRELVASGIADHFHAGVWRHRLHNGQSVHVDIDMHKLLFRGVPARMSQIRDVTVELRAKNALGRSEKRFRDLFEHSTGFICTHDLDGNLLSINPAAADALGYAVHDLLGGSLRELMPPELQHVFADYIARLQADNVVTGILVLQHRDGSSREWQYRNRLFNDDDGSSFVMGYAQDITDQRRAEHALRRSEQQIRTVTDALPLRVAYADTRLRYVFVNARYEKDFGLRRDEIIGRGVAEVIGANTFARRKVQMDRALYGNRQHFEDEYGSGRFYACEEVTYVPEIASEGSSTVLGMHIMVQDVTARKLEEQRLIQLAEADPLTGLLNRSGFSKRLDRAIQRSDDQHASLALMYLDLDSFKPVNDQHGHAAGDLLLQAFADRLRSTLRSSDVPVRLGGDEFAVIMEGLPDQAPVIAMAQRIIDAVAQAFPLREHADAAPDQPIHIGVSIGMAMHRDSRESASALIKRADTALYEAKRSGRGTSRMAEDFSSRSQDR